MTTAAADELVVVRCQLGERAAFGELVERWHHPLWSFVHRMVGDRRAATTSRRSGLLDRLELENVLAELAPRDREVVARSAAVRCSA